MAGPVNFVFSQRSLDDGSDLLSVEGDTTSAAAERIRKRAEELVRHGDGALVIDLSGVSFVDSALVAALGDVAASAKQQQVRLLVVEPVDPNIARPLELGRLDLVAEVLPTLAAAAGALNLAPGSLKPAIPPPAPQVPVTRPRRTVFGRRATDQEILRELGQLRRLTQELQRELVDRSGSHAPDGSAELQRLRARLAEARAEADSARAEADRMEAEAESAHAEADRMETEAEEAHARIQALEGDLAAAQEAAALVRRELEGAATAAGEEAATRIQILDTDLARAQQEAETLRRDLEAALSAPAASDDADRMRAELRAARSEADRMEAEAEQAHARNQELEASLDQARSRILALETANADLRARNEAPTPAIAAPAAPESRAAAPGQPGSTPPSPPEPPQPPEPSLSRRAAAPKPAPPTAPVTPRGALPVWADPTPVDLNTATIDDLMLLPGIGRRPAERILEHRESAGGFRNVDDLYAIEEIPKDRITRIRPYVRV